MADEVQETEEDKHYRLLLQLLSRIEQMGKNGLCNPTDFYTKETATFWAEQKAFIKKNMSDEDKKRIEERKKKKLLADLGPENRRILGVG